MGDPPPDHAALRHALDEAAHGRLEPTRRALVAATASARPALALASWFAGERAVRPHGSDELCAVVERCSGAELRSVALALPMASRACLLAFDHRGLQRLTGLARRLADEGALPLLDRDRIVLRLAVMDRSATVDDAVALEQSARRAEVAEVVVEAAALGALAGACRGAIDEALALARRSVRMARTEGLRQEHYFAGLVLARVRRLLEQPHLASHILTTLARVAPAPWRPWIDWELALASCTTSSEAEDGGPGRQLVALALGYAAGDDAGARDAAARLAEQIPEGSWGHPDWRCAQALLDPRSSCDDDQLHAFRSGERDRIPHGMVQLLADAPPIAFVVAGSALSEGALRVGARGVTMVVPAEGRYERTQRQQRVFTLLAVVAGASPAGIDEELAFARTYGFAYERSVHQDVFSVLVHRARATLGDRAELIRGDGRMSLIARAPVAIPDPRCEPPLDDRVLSLVSRRGAMGARAISSSLGVSLRSAQKSLEALVDDGACQRVKEGRAVAYAVEDTTFSEPTERHG